MKYRSLLILGVCFGLAGCQPKANRLPFQELSSLELTEEESGLVSVSNDFAFRFFQQTARQDSSAKPLFLSPLSAQFNLGMLANGAAGKTLQEIATALVPVGADPSSANPYFRKLMHHLPRLDSTTTFQSANSLWIHHTSPVKPSFQQTNRQYFQAEVRNLDFADPQSARILNRWTEKHTQGRIRQIVDKTQGDCILLNTLFFQGGWLWPFDPSDTRLEDFHPSPGHPHPVRMMHQSDTYFPFHETAQFEMVKLLYGNGSYAMTLLLPRPGVSVDSCLAACTEGRWKEWMLALEERNEYLDLKLPSFQLDFKKSLCAIFKGMGIHEAFREGEADFSRMTPQPAHISEVVQWTRLEVTETGTVAAAATLTDVVFESEVVAVPRAFHVNRPFLLFIHETKSGLLLFMGKVNDIP